MNHITEKHDFKIGDLVYHDCDAKEPRMMIRIVQIKESAKLKMYGCKYIDKAYLEKLGWHQNIFWNPGECLHDIKCFEEEE